MCEEEQNKEEEKEEEEEEKRVFGVIEKQNAAKASRCLSGPYRLAPDAHDVIFHSVRARGPFHLLASGCPTQENK